MRDASGKLTPFYHGTDVTFPDFDESYLNKNDWAKGFFLTDSPEYTAGYAFKNWPAEAREAATDLMTRQRLVEASRQRAAESIDPGERAYHLQQAAQAQQGVQYATNRLEREQREAPWMFQGAPQTRAVYPDVRQPFDLHAPASPELANEVRAAYTAQGQRVPTYKLDQSNGALLEALSELHGNDVAQAWLKSHGYDALIERPFSRDLGRRHTVVVPFSSEQIYPAANVEGGG
jgi:hypothetical protein